MKGWPESHPFFVYLPVQCESVKPKTNNIMKESNFVPSPMREGYESPVIQVAEIQQEGVLCQSGQIEEWNEETLEW